MNLANRPTGKFLSENILRYSTTLLDLATGRFIFIALQYLDNAHSKSLFDPWLIEQSIS